MKAKRKLSFEEFDYTPLRGIITGTPSSKILKIGGFIETIDDPIYVDEDPPDDFRCRATISDFVTVRIVTANISKGFYDDLCLLKDLRKPVELLGRIVREPMGKGKIGSRNCFEVHKIRPADRPLRLLRVSREEERLVNQFVRHFRSEIREHSIWTLLDAIKAAVIDHIGIVGTEMDMHFNDSLTAIICQAFSGGRVNNTNGKISTCIIGPPASGKKLLADGCILLNCVSHEADPIRTTAPGLTGAVVKKNDKWSIQPGILPTVNHGVLVIEDFDKCEKSTSILPVLGKVMEDGKCNIVAAAKAVFDSQAAVHIDINRRSDLLADKTQRVNVVQDTTLPTYILSRFDYVCELRKDAGLQSNKALLLLSSKKRTGRKPGEIALFCSRNDIGVPRFLKVLTSYVRTEFTNIDRDPVRKYMTRRFKEISTANRDNIKKLGDMAMFMMRLSNAVEKFVTAATRLQLRTKANRAAVDMAFHLLSRKLTFLREFNKEFSVPHYKLTRDDFPLWLVRSFRKRTFAPAEAFKKYRKDGFPCGVVKERRFRDLIKPVCEKVGQGEWKVRKTQLKRYLGD